LQFSSDATEAGFDVSELGDAFKLEDGGYRWWTDHGQLIEQYGELKLIEGERA
jgi:hypothetical protein